jgi:hypothetical protein
MEEITMVSGFDSLVKKTPARACARRHTGVGIGAHQRHEHGKAGRPGFEAILTAQGEKLRSSSASRLLDVPSR